MSAPRATERDGLASFWFQFVRNLFRWFGSIDRELRTRRGRSSSRCFRCCGRTVLPRAVLIVLKISFASAVFARRRLYLTAAGTADAHSRCASRCKICGAAGDRYTQRVLNSLWLPPCRRRLSPARLPIAYE